MHVTLIFPHQLFPKNPAISGGRRCVLVEDSLFFGDDEYPVAFHQQKIVLHRASMRDYAQQLRQKGFAVDYLSFVEKPNLAALFSRLKKEKIEKVHITDPTDYTLEKRLSAASAKTLLPIIWHENPSFCTPKQVAADFFAGKKRAFMADFYTFQRKRMGILVDEHQKPIGGKWSFDTENRKKLPKNIAPPSLPAPRPCAFLAEAKQYVQRHFPKNPGSVDGFNYPINAAQASDWLDDFLHKRFANFGPYEDALSATEQTIFHSVLSSSMNIGLLPPEEIIQKTLAFAQKNAVPLPSLEGFIRQIIGWREFMRAMYERSGSQMRRRNFWGHERKIPPAFWRGETGLPPVDLVIKNLHRTAYAHHIERLMVLGNIMLLCEFCPHEIYRFFMAMFIDSYDWVMVPNVYAMSQFADGGTMTTKPYFSSANYLRKMSDYPKGEWEAIWDGLFWRFIEKHAAFFQKNYRLSMMARQLQNMPADKKARHLQAAEDFLHTLA